MKGETTGSRNHYPIRPFPYRLAAPASKTRFTRVYTSRIDCLRRTGAVVKFLSIEPLIGPAGPMDLSGKHWVIAGGESGPDARRMKREWVVDIRRQCREAHVAFFFKQWGGVNKKKAGRVLDGRTYDEMPATSVQQTERSLTVVAREN